MLKPESTPYDKEIILFVLKVCKNNEEVKA